MYVLNHGFGPWEIACEGAVVRSEWVAILL